ncbi:Disease resistance protein [Actinidia chinensis var. chinensis]|uniref:Disease resistance protein n=1 Tax=Actinidia chinensis var. chinensis TaxID=1590841 RepID=A0A2R6Q6N0_ACTCC|nr:Disease resistance protein [Actinidia chinensis var. chinensis]PSS02919.1 Disease resistance protein [Actinidia chinensis var. chinensis]
MVEVVTAVSAAMGALSQAKTSVLDPIVDKIAASNDMEEIYTVLNEAVAMLGAKREDHQNVVQRHKTKMSSRTYDQWIRRVNKTEEEVKKLLNRYDRQSKSSTVICFLPRSDFSKEMKKKGEKVVKLLEEGNQLRRILVDQPAESVIKLKAPDIKKFPTLQGPLDETLDLLKHDRVRGVRILGMMGTGKTAIMKNLNNHEEVINLFDIVMWIKVSTEESEENLSVGLLQKTVAERLKLDMAGIGNIDDAALRISCELEGKKYLLLLDDVKDDLDIHEIGIPYCANGSKIVLTARWNHVCSSLVNRVVKVNYLSLRESWTMFQEILDRPDLKVHLQVEPLVRQIVKECGGHPLLIKIVANVFKMKDEPELWSEGLNSLKRFSEKEHRGLKEMEKVIKFCYDDLEESQRKCFLYGALYPEDSDIYADYLLECWEAEDLLSDDNGARKASMNGRHVLRHLKNKSLLEEGKTEKYVTMHKCIRQVALYISSDDAECKQLVNSSGLRMPPNAKCWSDMNRISLVDNKFEMLPDCPSCDTLSTLFLQRNLALKIIPAAFFECMKSLKVLDLCHTGITLLPSSLSKVVGLKVLYLSHCKYLVDLPSNLDEFEHLEVLDIRRSGINNIPSQVENLEGLRRLRVSFKCGNENDTEEVDCNCNVISRLSALEELVIDVKSPSEWSNKVVKKIIEKVATLEKLTSLQFCFFDEVVDVIEVVATTLRIHVPEADILHTFIEKTRSWRNIRHIQSFQFFIGCQESKYPRIPEFYEYERYVKYCDGEGSNHPILEDFVDVDAFELVNHKDIKEISDLGIPIPNQVRGCLIEGCSELVTAIDSTTLPNLEHLYMKNLLKLEGIWSDRTKATGLTKLKTLVLSSCQMLKNIFPLVVILQLREMEYLKIEDCSEIVEVVEKAVVATGNMDLLPKLRKLILRDLLNLESICLNESSTWSALEKLKIHNCPTLHKLPFSKDNAEKLIKKPEKHWWDALQW